MASFVGLAAVLILGSIYSEPALAIVIPNPAPAATVSPAVTTLAGTVADGMTAANATLVASLVRGSISKGTLQAAHTALVCVVRSLCAFCRQRFRAGTDYHLQCRASRLSICSKSLIRTGPGPCGSRRAVQAIQSRSSSSSGCCARAGYIRSRSFDQ